MSEILYEVRGNKIRKSTILLVPKSELSNYRGFRSVFGFPNETAEIVLSQNSTRNIGNLATYSNDMLLDFDSNEAAADGAAEWLVNAGIDFEVWHSGGRSVHIHIETIPMQGLGVPFKHKKFIATFFGGADLSFYHAAGMYRLPGTLHEKNLGNYKRIQYYSAGIPLDIGQYMQEFSFEPSYTDVQNSSKEQVDMEKMLTYQMFRYVGEGGRNRHVYIMSRLCIDLGYDIMYTTEVVKAWNDTLCNPPLSDQEIGITVSSAYQARSKV